MKAYKRLLATVLILTMILALTACAGSKAESAPDPVRIATKPMTEQFILCEMLGLLIEQAGYKVEITKGVGGGTNNIHPAMESGEFDLYPEYTSSGWVLVLDQGQIQQCDVPTALLRQPATAFVAELMNQRCRSCFSPDNTFI